MIGVKKVTNKIDVICIRWLLVLADMSFAVRIILAIHKKIKTIMIVVDKSSKDQKLLKSILLGFIIEPEILVIFFDLN